MRNDFEPMSDKKMSPQNRFASLPSSTSSPYVDKWMELFLNPRMLPRAPESRAFRVNNVLDFAERISFFWNKPYEKNFLATL
jgi:hypothetical protein